MSNTKSNDAEDILSEFDSRNRPDTPAEIPNEQKTPDVPEPEETHEPPAVSETDSLDAPEPQEESRQPSAPEERDTIFVGTKPIMTYVSATLTQLSTMPTVTLKARGKRITQAVDVSQMIVKRMDSVGYVISDVRTYSASLPSQDGKHRNVSVIEIDISKN